MDRQVGWMARVARRATHSAVLATLIVAARSAVAEEVVVKNDSVIDGSNALIQAGFIAGESAAAWLTSPCEGRIVAVQVFWRSILMNEPPSLEDSITLFNAGSFPEPGSVMINDNGWDAIFEAPVMTDGFLNEFRFLDEQQQVPLSVPISEDQTFVVSFKFANSPNPLIGPSVVTDTDGCQFGRDAVFALPGGWINPCALGMSGDFFIRAVIDCNEQEGACCFVDGSCEILPQTECGDAGGSFEGPNVTCEEADCPLPEGACCFEAGGCIEFTEEICTSAGGFWQGAFTSCEEVDCFPEGACCLPDGSCEGPLSPGDCEALDGTFQGPDTACETVECPAPTGACCFDTGFCVVLTEADCSGAGTWAGPLTDCADLDGNGTADACEPPCPGDLNGDLAVNVMDLLALLAAWGGDGPADLNDDGVVNVLDLLLLLGAWGDC